MATKKENNDIEVMELHTRRLTFCLVGETPLIMNRFSEKARQEMLLPAPKKNRAEKATSLKHDPIAEFRGGLYMSRDENAPTAIHFPTNAFHKAVGQAAIDIPGQAKSVMLRLTSVVTDTVHLYGNPALFCRMVRSSGMNATPDIRTRPIFSEWACALEFQIVSNLVKETQVANLLAAAGTIVGMGDWRPQKGGSYGRFRLTTPDDPEFKRIVEHQGRASQLQEIAAPQFHDDETEELLEWFFKEADKREMRPTLPAQFKIAAE
jgi:hypothetical protein